MKALILSLLLVSGAAQAAPFDCKPTAFPNGETQSGQILAKITDKGAFMAFKCRNTGQVNMIVIRKNFLTPALFASVQAFLLDPSHARMNTILAANQTGDWKTDPSLVEVYSPHLEAIKTLKEF